MSGHCYDILAGDLKQNPIKIASMSLSKELNQSQEDVKKEFKRGGGLSKVYLNSTRIILS